MDMDSFYETRPPITLIVGITGKQRGRIISADDAFGDLLDLAPDSLAGRPVTDFIHPDSRDEASAQLARVIARECRRFDGVFRVPTGIGTVRWLSIHACLTSSSEPERLILRVFALPVRLLAVDAAKAQRTSSTDRLAVALDLAPVAPGQLVL
jgi:PAS domain S-box-containing protein